MFENNFNSSFSNNFKTAFNYLKINFGEIKTCLKLQNPNFN